MYDGPVDKVLTGSGYIYTCPEPAGGPTLTGPASSVYMEGSCFDRLLREGRRYSNLTASGKTHVCWFLTASSGPRQGLWNGCLGQGAEQLKVEIQTVIRPLYVYGKQDLGLCERS